MASQKLDETAAGVFIISATPFTEAGALDLDSADRLVDFYIEKGVSGITVLGMMGEAQKMAPDEAEAFLVRVLQRVDGRVQVVVGVSSAGMENLVRLARFGMDNGAAGVMVAPLAGLSNEEKIYKYFADVFAALGDGIPVCYQDYPFATRSDISVPLRARSGTGGRPACLDPGRQRRSVPAAGTRTRR
jgi:4-hydroxy-tetrahydrodipicolinate synthase